MPAPLKPTRRVRKLPQTPGGVAKTRSRGPPPKLPPRASIVSAAAPAAATPIPPSVEEEGRRKAGGYNGGAGAGAGTSSTGAGAATVANPISTSISAVKPISIQQQRQSSPANAASTATSTTPRLNKRQMAVATLVAAEQAYGKRIALLETVFGKIARTPDAFAPLRDLLLTAPPLVSPPSPSPPQPDPTLHWACSLVRHQDLRARAGWQALRGRLANGVPNQAGLVFWLGDGGVPTHHCTAARTK